MGYFWVFQNKTFSEELKGEFLWAPQYDSVGKRKSHWDSMKSVKPGDFIIHCVKQKIVAISIAMTCCYISTRPEAGFGSWQREGWRVDTKYFLFPKAIATSECVIELTKLQPKIYGPFNKKARGNTGYLFFASKDMYELVLDKVLTTNLSSKEKRIFLLLKDEKNEISNKENAIADESLKVSINESINKIGIDLNRIDFQYAQVPKKRGASILSGFIEVYPRNKKVASNALLFAKYLCESNNSHKSFIRKNLNVPYTEPHHLIPLSYSKHFDVSLDVEENIVSLCSNCHNQLHYGKEFEEILKQLYNQRSDLLKNVGLTITYEELLVMYL